MSKAATADRKKLPDVPTVSIDFDGTIIELQDGHDLGKAELKEGVREGLRDLHHAGLKIIILTAHPEPEKVEEWLVEHDLPYDWFNENPQRDDPDIRKIDADVYIDDKALNPSGKPWDEVVRQVVQRVQGKARQPIERKGGYKALRQLAEDAQPELEGLLAPLKFRTLYLGSDEIGLGGFEERIRQAGGIVVFAPIKKKGRAKQKVWDEYEGDWSRLLDVVRASVAVDTFDELWEAMDRVGGEHARAPKDRFASPLKNGYRDVLTNYRLPCGMICEVQYHLKPFLIARERQYNLYGVIRALYDTMEEEGRDEMTDAEQAAEEQYQERSKELFDRAWEEVQRGQSDRKEGHGSESVSKEGHGSGSVSKEGHGSGSVSKEGHGSGSVSRERKKAFPRPQNKLGNGKPVAQEESHGSGPVSEESHGADSVSPDAAMPGMPPAPQTPEQQEAEQREEDKRKRDEDRKVEAEAYAHLRAAAAAGKPGGPPKDQASILDTASEATDPASWLSSAKPPVPAGSQERKATDRDPCPKKDTEVPYRKPCLRTRLKSRVRKAGGWITIGGEPASHSGREEQHHGGTPVYVDEGGNVAAGPSHLVGHPLNNLPRKPKQPEEEQDGGPKRPKHGSPGRPGAGPAGTVPPETGPAVAPAPARPDAPTPGADREAVGQPSGPGAVAAVPAGSTGPAATIGGKAATKEEINRRLDRFTERFRAKGNHPVAGWLERLKEHINDVGGETALAELGAQKVEGAGPSARYEGAVKEGDNWQAMGPFVEDYLARAGISLVPTGTIRPAGEGGLVSSITPGFGSQLPREEGRASAGAADEYLTASFLPKDPTFKNKLEEAQHLPGLEKSQDLNQLAGKPVAALTPDVLDKLDQTYGKDGWIVKAYGDDAFAGYGIFFPQRARQLQQDALNTIATAAEQLKKHGFTLHRDQDGRLDGLEHPAMGLVPYWTDKYDQLYGDVRHWGDQAGLAASNERGAALPNGGKEFMAQPAFQAAGVNDADRAAGKTIAPGEARVHVVARGGKVEIVPHSTWIKGDDLPVVFEDEETRAIAAAAQRAIEALPDSEKQAHLYAPDVLKTAKGYEVVEANPANQSGSSGYLGDNPFIIDAYVSHLLGRTPAHVRFIRRLLTKKGPTRRKHLRPLSRWLALVTKKGDMAGQPCKPGQPAQRDRCVSEGGHGGANPPRRRSAEGSGRLTVIDLNEQPH